MIGQGLTCGHISQFSQGKNSRAESATPTICKGKNTVQSDPSIRKITSGYISEEPVVQNPWPIFGHNRPEWRPECLTVKANVLLMNIVYSWVIIKHVL